MEFDVRVGQVRHTLPYNCGYERELRLNASIGIHEIRPEGTMLNGRTSSVYK